MEYADKFGEDEIKLLDLFGEILSEMDEAEFTNEPLNANYLHGYHTQQNALNVIGVEEASELWGLSAGYIKNLCAEGKIKAKKIGKTWVLDKNQISPKKG
jgi:excisionase family DNA binding protein